MKRFNARQMYAMLGFALILGVFTITGCGGGGSGHWLPGATAPSAPTVTAVVPANNTLDVAINTKIITAAFSSPMEASTITTTNFKLECPSGVPVAGTVASYMAEGNVATLTLPAATNLPASTICTATVTTGAKDLAGAPLASNYVWTFTTGTTPDATRPLVLMTVPATTIPGPTTGVSTNTSITAVFNEDMAPATIIGSTFTVTGPGGATVAGAVTYVVGSRTAVFTPSATLAVSSTYIATVSVAAKDLAGNALASNYVWSFTTGAAPDTTRPTVIATNPSNGDTGVAVNTKSITAAFSEGMNSSTLTTASFTLKCPTTTITGTAVSYQEAGFITTLTLPAATNLPNSVVCTATVTAVASDLAGNTLATSKIWTFTTSAAPDTSRPTVTVTNPADTDVDVAVNTKTITAAFSEAMNPATLTPTSFKLACPAGTPVTGTVVTYLAAGNLATLTIPMASDMNPSTVCTATITTAATDVAGNGMLADKVWTFTTSAAADATRPTVTVTNPADLDTNVAVNTKSITAAFSEPMNPATLTTASFTLKCPTTTITGTSVAYTAAGNVATLTLPSATSLPNSTVCTGTITTVAKDLAGNALLANKVWTFTTSAALDTTRPTVTAVVPLDAATNVAINTKTVTAAFSEAMNPSTLTTASFTLKCPTTVITGTTVSYLAAGNLATLTLPAATDLPASTICTATVSTTAADLAGNTLLANKVWTFTTGLAPDIIRPTVTATSPISNAINVAVKLKTITGTFSEAMNPLTLTTASFTLKCPAASPAITGTSVSYTAATFKTTLTIPLATDLPASTICTATITTLAKDVAGNALLADKVWTFTTGAIPTVTTTNPADADVNVALNKKIEATFSEAMDSATITAANTFTLKHGVTTTAGTVTYAAGVATFTPGVNLLPNTLYTATITTAAQNPAGNGLAVNKVWTFTTGTQTAQFPGQLTVPLGAASTFAILGSAGITNIPTSSITGDVGLTPDAGSNITGFSVPASCPEIKNPGKLYAVDVSGPACALVDPVLLGNAKSGALAAFTDARAATRGTPTAISGNLNGLTLYPGLYESGTSLQISAGGLLYLDAQGDSSAVFIIRSATTITTLSTSEVVLTKGAKAANVFWTAGSAVTLGPNSKMKGTMIAGTALTLQNGANLEGRALNQGAAAAAIGCDACTIVLPLP